MTAGLPDRALQLRSLVTSQGMLELSLLARPRTTTYLGDTIDALRAHGIEVRDEIAAHLTPAQHDHINFYGTYSFDIDAELRSMTTSTSTAPTRSTSTPNSAATGIARCASPPDLHKIAKTPRIVPLLSRPLF
jgi:Tn3 transposase DDE domain